MYVNAPRVSIIILNWNGWKDTIECLESLYRITYPNYDVIVVDNGSRDDSVQKIKEYAEGKIRVNSKFFDYNPNNKPIKVFEINESEARQGEFNKLVYEKFDPNRRMILIKNNNNYGYAGGNNVGIKFALSVLDPGYVLLLNNDTVVDPNFLTELVKVAESDEKIGIVGPKIYYYDYKGRSDVISFAGEELILWKGTAVRYGEREVDRGQWDKLRVVDKIEGSCMLIKGKVLERIGLFDEKFFCYWEETDLCFRAKRKGYTLVYVPKAKIWHKIASSSGGTLRPFYIYHMTRNRIWFLIKNELYKSLKINLLYVFIWEIWFRFLTYLVYYKRPSLFSFYMQGIFDGIRRNKKF
ncbi:glycosyltransferase family 2 protein [Pyrococcus abyssi]|uniref:Rhamnosyl transferase related protein n=1 Tax=Pyrococcus abyssi (strain GE5 / Orsay) TaxID=272844 RepID=Q9UZG0_PYRAB|nr:glycosyltransferase family 2 protein [Pyrococcus abyssi]CAB50099.1 glycosyltransferase family protein, substrate unknown [Pyrococcus abyssi GE5]CCE70619.1 TPA: rhamnosyl transferase related protein [Pyrococcus abyssi GE5]